MASLFISVYLFGFTSNTENYTPYKNMNQCTNALEIMANKAKHDPNNEVIYSKETKTLKIANNKTHKIATHQCKAD